MLFRMAILCISGSMYRLLFVLFIALFCMAFFHQEAFAQSKQANDIAEGSGTVIYSGVSVRAEPNTDSKVLRTASKSEKVLILSENGDWLKVRMGNGKEGYINKKYVRMGRVFRDESSTTNSMDKKASFEIQDILGRFNSILRNSSYAAKYQAVPMIELKDARKSKGVMTLTFVYSCINLEGQMIPSYKKNMLQSQMIGVLELIFAKLLLTDTDIFKIIINIPQFDDKGQVINIDKPYAEITVNNSDVELENIKNNVSNIWSYAKINIGSDELFADFPKGLDVAF